MANGRNSNILLGVLLGGAIAGASALFLQSKTGRTLKNNVVDGCQQLGDKFGEAVEAISEKTETLKEQFAETADEWQHRANKAAKKARRAVNSVVDQIDTKEITKVDARIGLLVGALLGGAVSVGLATWMNSKNQRPVSASISSYITPYLHELKNVVNNLSDLSQSFTATASASFKEEGEGPLQEAVDFALSGAKLWNHIRKGAKHRE